MESYKMKYGSSHGKRDLQKYCAFTTWDPDFEVKERLRTGTKVSKWSIPSAFCVDTPTELNNYTPVETDVSSLCTLALRIHPDQVGPMKDVWQKYQSIHKNYVGNNKPIIIKVSPHNFYESNPLIEELQEVFKECQEEDWDGYGASPLSLSTYYEAVRLISLLPSFTNNPEIVPEPNGDIAFEWYRGKHLTFVISVRGENKITYAGIFGKSNMTHGVEYFPNEIPPIILNYIKRLYC